MRSTEKQGAKTVLVWLSNVDTKWATLAVTIYGDGNKLKPLLIFKGKLIGKVDNDLTSFHNDCHCGVQEIGWMHEPLIQQWIDDILEHDIATAPCGIVPIFILKSYKVGFMSSEDNRIENS